MRYFSLLDLQHTVLALVLGFVGLVFAAAAWGGYRRREGSGVPPATVPDEIPGAEHNPVAPFLVFVYVGTVAGAVGYAIVVGLLGGPVGY
ncbi:MAG: hypothetical protein HZB55_08260 [Deltaproteobacteria bacterium]|nr:hypothetical protein [Deltaproteobacteria bacterium]